MIIGYARVSTDAQALDAQFDALRAAGAEHIFHEKISGARRDRPELRRLQDKLNDGDVLLVTRLDRLARWTTELRRDRFVASCVAISKPPLMRSGDLMVRKIWRSSR
jgi:DNA invertase Pin-like site-specific DNA recombinase